MYTAIPQIHALCGRSKLEWGGVQRASGQTCHLPVTLHAQISGNPIILHKSLCFVLVIARALG